MSKNFNFPHNNKVYIKNIISNTQNNKLEEALDLTKKVYKEEKNFDNNYLYMYILSTLNRHSEAYEIARRFEEDYLKNDITRQAYILLLIKTHHFIKAEYHILQIEEAVKTSKIDYNDLKEKLEDEKLKVENALQKRKNKIKLELLQIANYSEIVQQNIVRESHILELAILQKNANYIFMHPNLSQQIKKSYLEILIIKKDSNKYKIEWFNESMEVCPKKLKTFDELLSEMNFDSLLSTKLEKTPSLFEIIRYEMINDMLLLYPFVEETITNLNFWIDQYIKHFDSAYVVADEANINTQDKENMEKWIEKMHLLSHRI